MRQAVSAANASAGNIVEFAPALVGSTITLSGSQIAIQKSMTIAGPGKDSLTISGNNASRIFYVRPVPDDTDPTHTVVSISGMTLTNGNANPLTTGGTIRAVHSQLSVMNSTISGGKAWFGAGLSTLGGVLYVGHSRLVGNQASVSGGGVDSDSDTSVHLIGNSISGNTAAALGAGVYVQGTADALIVASTISGNNVLQPDIGTPSQGGGGVMFQNIPSMAARISSTRRSRRTTRHPAAQESR